MTGTHYGPVHFFTAVSGGMPNDEVTFAEIAKQAGYATGIVGNCLPNEASRERVF